MRNKILSDYHSLKTQYYTHLNYINIIGLNSIRLIKYIEFQLLLNRNNKTVKSLYNNTQQQT